MKKLYWLGIICGLVALTSCGVKSAKERLDEEPPVFPDYTDVTVPKNIAPLNFEILGARRIQAILTNQKGTELKVSGKRYVDIPLKGWRKLMADGGDIRVEVSAWTEEHPEGASYLPFTLHVSQDEIDDWIAYRFIPPGYEGWDKMGIYERNLTNFDTRPIVENSQNNNGCLNCHSFARYKPDDFMFHARGEGGGTIVCHNGKIEKVDIKSMGPRKHGSYNYWHPSGRFIAFSSNATHQSFYSHSRDKIEVYDLGSDMIIYDVEKHDVLADARFNDSINWETFPCFSPDGKWLYFSTGKGVMMPKEFDKLHYSLIRVPFDEKDGSLGAEIDTIYNAEVEGGSVLMPRISPDGRYLMYTWAECGAFHLYHKEADLRMIDLETGYSIDTSPLNSNDVESHHAWSSTGRWVMLSSKRVDTRYTRVFLSHWDGKEFSKAFLLPQRDPEYNTQLMFSYNIPEFMLEPVDIPKDQLADFFKLK